MTDAPVSTDASHGSARANAWRKLRASPLLVAFTGSFVGLAALITTVGIAGSAVDGSPEISLEMAPFPPPGERPATAPPAPPTRVREIQGHLIADPALIEDSPQGPLPQRARDGRTPMMAYARPYDRNSKRPKIALIVRGLGVGGGITAAALAQLAPEITLAFTPFALGVQSQIDNARGAGHEVLIEVPMEPFDFPDSDPGPHALLVAAPSEENGKRLEWALSRATGYAGVMNLLGARFMGEQSAIEPVLDRVARRGLMFFDNGASSNSVVITAARHVKTPVASGTLTLDAIQTKAAIDVKLAELEDAARQEGFAIGVASAYPVTIARISEWASNVDGQGFDLVPVSALARVPGTGETVKRK